MVGILDDALAAGYVGFSTDALPFHYLANDPHRQTRIPTQWTTRAELSRLPAIYLPVGALVTVALPLAD